MSVVANNLRSAPISAWIGIALVAAYVVVAIAAPWLAPYGETEIAGTDYEPWSSAHLLGTDNVGRDMLSRLIYGMRNTGAIALIATLVAFVLGTAAGFLAAAVGGLTDQLLGRLVDILMAIPSLIFALLFLTVIGTSIPTLILVIGLLDATRIFRVARAVAMNIVVLDFVETARLRGEGAWWVVTREIVPNAAPTLLAEFGLRFCFIFLFISALSFLGLGIQPPTADLGAIVRENAILISFGDYTPLIAAAAIALLTVGVNFIVDWMLQITSGLKE